MCFGAVFIDLKKFFTFFQKKDGLIFATNGFSIIFASVWVLTNQLIISITNNYGENFERGCRALRSICKGR